MSTSSSMESGLTSVRNPRRPRLTPSMRHRIPGHQPRGIQQCAVPADGDDEIRAGGERGFGAEQHAVRRKVQTDAGIDQGAHPFRVEVADEAEHAFGDAQIRGVADQRDGLERNGT